MDSLAVVNRTWEWWAAAHDLDPAPFQDAHGRTSLDAIAQLAPQLDAQAEAALVEDREAQDTQGVVALPGAAAMLASEAPTAIATSATRRLAVARLRAAGLPTPPVLITAEEVRRGKPDPEPYLRAAWMLGVGPAMCTVFEDAPAGVRSGKAAGMRVVAVTTTVAADQLSEADVVVADLAAYLRLANAEVG